jgi:hypothetical protein
MDENQGKYINHLESNSHSMQQIASDRITWQGTPEANLA